MEDIIETKHEEWLSSAGYKQECWVILRNGWELGRIQYFEKAYEFGGKYMAMQSYEATGHWKHKYFVRFDKARKWLVREMATIRPIAELNAFLY